MPVPLLLKLSYPRKSQNHEIPPQNPCDCKPGVPPTPPQMGAYVTGQI